MIPYTMRKGENIEVKHLYRFQKFVVRFRTLFFGAVILDFSLSLLAAVLRSLFFHVINNPRERRFNGGAKRRERDARVCVLDINDDDDCVPCVECVVEKTKAHV